MLSSIRHRSFARLPLLAMVILLCGCGYRLAGTAELPSQLASIQLVTTNFSEAQKRMLARELTSAGANLVDQAGGDVVTLTATLGLEPDRQLVSSASSGTTVNRLSRTLDYTLRTASGKAVGEAQTLRQQVDLELDDDNLLASNREKESAILQLERALYQQLIRQLTRI